MEKNEDKSLRDKAVDIKGKQYVLVQDRVIYFNEHYPKGCITTELISAPDSKHIIVKARVSPDEGPRLFTGYSQAVIGEGMVNKTAALENAETSAVGRALAFMGIGVIESIASADEMTKAGVGHSPAAKSPSTRQTGGNPEKPEPPSQIAKKREIMHNRIVELAEEMALVPLLGEDEIAKYVHENTGLEFKPENYMAIGLKLKNLREGRVD